MNVGYAISDFVLALACAVIAVRAAKTRPGVALACAAIGVAAIFGVLRFSGTAGVEGAHRFLSMLGGAAALPLLAASLAWPESLAASTVRGAALTLLVAAAIGVAVTVGAGFVLWGQAVPALSAVAILIATLPKHAVRKSFGAVVLVLTFGLVAARQTLAGFEPLEVLHYGMTTALLLLCL